MRLLTAVRHIVLDDEGEGRIKIVTRDAEDLVEIKWPCGDGLTFDADDAYSTVLNLEALAEAAPGIWMKLPAREGSAYHARIMGDLIEVSDNRFDHVAHRISPPWKLLKKAIKRAVRDLDRVEMDAAEATRQEEATF